MAAAMTGSAFAGVGVPLQAQAAETWIGDDQLEENSTPEPKADNVLPSTNQYNYQKEELAAFCHFGPNTFNEIEWGENYGNKTPNEIFKLTKDFDADTLVKAIKDAGFHKLIVTAKHHDGFCIWASDYTEYDVDAATNYPGDGETGRRDILEEISAACTEYDIDMGLYLSPWDIHDPSYGYYDENRNPVSAEEDVLDYNDYYNNQLEEILSDDRYGNDGHFVEVWMDGAKGSGANAQEYDFERWFATIQKYEGKASGKYDSDCMLFGAQAYTTVRWIGNENGYADKNTWSKSKVNYDTNSIDSRSQGGYTLGWEDGNQWTVPEADARITSGWFWGTTKASPKSLEALGTMYFNSVGHNSPLLLNIPPNNQGTVDEAILERLAEFGENIKDTFSFNMASAAGAEVKASEVRGNSSTFGPGKTVDGDDSTYWTTEDGTSTGQILIDLGTEKRFDIVSIEEAIQNGQRINSYKVEYRTGDGAWTEMDSGQTIGAKRLVRTSAVRADQVRITVSVPEGKVPMISEVGVYKASEGFELAGSAPAGMEVVDIEDTNTDDGAGFDFGTSTWTAEKGSHFVNGTNRWTKAGGELTFTFRGSKFYIVGTKDPGHGNAAVTIDGGEPVTVSTKADSRSTGQIWYTSPDLEDGTHTVTIRAVDGPIGIEAAYVINNGGVGMIGLEQSKYTMNEDETINVKVIRVGGSKGEISALLTGNPGSAVQGDFDTTPKTVTMGDGVTEAMVPVTSRRSDDEREPVESRDFTIVLDTPSPEELILGFNDTATVNILDAEWMTKDKLQELVTSVDGRVEGEWIGDYAAYAAALAEAKALLGEADPDALAMMLAYQKLEAAAGAMAAAVKVTLSVDGGNGTAALDPEQTSYAAGTEVTVRFSPADGYAVEDVLINNESVMSNDIRNSNTYTFTVTENTDIVTKFAFSTYTETNRFYFPTEVNAEAKVLEAENLVLEDTGTGTAIRIDRGADWASGNAFVNWMNSGDKLILNYYAQAAGTYTVTMTYKSGSSANSISWEGEKIEPGSLDSVAADSGGNLQVRTVDFKVKVNEPGAGVITITAGQKNAPQTDKFDIRLTEAGETLPTDKNALGEKISEAQAEEAKTGVYTSESIAALNAAIAAAQTVFGNENVTQEEADAQVRALAAAIGQLTEIPKYKVEVTDSGNGTGTLSISGDIQDGSFVQEGGSISYTAQAAEGYVIDVLAVNGTPAADAAGKTTYTGTIENVTADVQISVSYKAAQTEQPDPGPGGGSGSADGGSQTGGSQTGGSQTGGSQTGGSQIGGSQTNSSQTDGTDKAVQTGDAAYPILWAGAAALAGAAVVTAYRKKVN